MHFGRVYASKRVFAFSQLLHFNFFVERFESDAGSGGPWSFDGGEFSSFPQTNARVGIDFLSTWPKRF